MAAGATALAAGVGAHVLASCCAQPLEHALEGAAAAGRAAAGSAETGGHARGPHAHQPTAVDTSSSDGQGLYKVAAAAATAPPGKRRFGSDAEAAAGGLPREEGWGVARARARLALARGLCPHREAAVTKSRRGVGLSTRFTGHRLSRQAAAPSAAPCCWVGLGQHVNTAEIAAVLGPELAAHAAVLTAAGYTVPAMWARVAANRKQRWLVDAGLAGPALRSARQGIVDAAAAHRAANAPDHACNRPRKRPNLLSIVDEQPPHPRDPAALFPSATMLPGLPPLPPPSRTLGGSGSGGGWAEVEFVPGTDGGSGTHDGLVHALAGAIAPVDGGGGTAVPQLVMVVGPVGSGKTSLLEAVAAAVAARQDDVTVAAAAAATMADGQVAWDRAAAIVSQFGGETGCLFLAAAHSQDGPSSST